MANGSGTWSPKVWDVLLGGCVDEERLVLPAPSEAQRVIRVRQVPGGPAVWLGHTGESAATRPGTARRPARSSDGQEPAAR